MSLINLLTVVRTLRAQTITWVMQYPVPQHHTECEPRPLGMKLPGISDHGLARISDRHAGRSKEMP